MKKKLLFIIILLLPFSIIAHPIKPSVFDITFKKNGTFEILVTTNMEVLLAGIKPNHKDTNDAPEFMKYNKLRALSSNDLEKLALDFEPKFKKGILLNFDNKPYTLEFVKFQIPKVGDLKLARKSIIIYKGFTPKDAKQLTFDFYSGFGTAALTITNEGEKNQFSHWNAYSSKSPPFTLHESIKPKPLSEVFLDYIVLGFEHIIPKGIDHILFVLGLFLLAQHWKPLLLQVTAFTIAHSVTLALTIFGLINLPSYIIEALIALSIVYIGIENIITKRLNNARIIIVFLFGLLHGMGFASVLMDLGLPEYAMTTALISFNIGVELGQLAVIALAFILTFYFFQHKLFRKMIVIPVSLIISVIGFYWFIERIGLIQ